MHFYTDELPLSFMNHWAPLLQLAQVSNNQYLLLSFSKRACTLVILLSLLLKGIEVYSSICSNGTSRIGSQCRQNSPLVVSIWGSQDAPAEAEIQNLIIIEEIQIIQCQWEFFEDMHSILFIK